MKNLIMPIGLPRAGKSTWAREQGYPIVSPDAIRLAIHGQPFISTAEVLVWPIVKVMVRALFQAGHSNVILDATNLHTEQRERWRSEDWVLVYRPFTTSVQVCQQRAIDGDRTDLLPVIKRMLENMDDDTKELLGYDGSV